MIFHHLCKSCNTPILLSQDYCHDHIPTKELTPDEWQAILNARERLLKALEDWDEKGSPYA